MTTNDMPRNFSLNKKLALNENAVSCINMHLTEEVNLNTVFLKHTFCK